MSAALAGCGSQSVSTTPVKLRPDQRPVRIGRGPGYELRAISSAVAQRAQVNGLRCAATERGGAFGVHLELFARRRVLIVPAGIGIAPPQHRRGTYVLGGSCSYPIRTVDPTGVIVVDRGTSAVLGTFFAVWGQPLSRSELAGFRGTVVAFVGGRRWLADPAHIPMQRHSEIVLEVGGSLLPHPSYRFPPGL